MTMILYDFKCTKCGATHEELVSPNVKTLSCPACKEDSKRMISPVHGKVQNPAAGNKVERWEVE